MAEIISIINYKGGVGKTTITLQLAVGLVTLYEKKVLVVDLDPQCSLSLATVDEHYWADWVEERGSIQNVFQSFYDEERPHLEADWIIEDALDRAWENMPGNTPGLDILPSHLDLPELEMRLVARKPRHLGSMDEFYLQRYLVLREAFTTIRKQYDYILLDCPPNIYMVARNAIIASDYYLVPTIPDFISCYGIPFILKHIESMQQEVRERGAVGAEARFLGIVRNRVRQSGSSLVREHDEQSKKLLGQYAEGLFEAMVMDRIGVAELLGSRRNVHQTTDQKHAEIRQDLARLAHETMERMRRVR